MLFGSKFVVSYSVHGKCVDQDKSSIIWIEEAEEKIRLYVPLVFYIKKNIGNADILLSTNWNLINKTKILKRQTITPLEK